MNKKTLVWALVVAVPVGIAALATAYFYRDTGKLPFQEAAETTTAPAGATDGTDAAVTAEASGEAREETVQADGGAESTDAASPAAKGPSFDVVGVEPTGETVVAGRSDAGAIVALTANGKVVGKSIANEAGEWTIILDEPLKPGDYDVGLEVHDEAGAQVAKSEEHVVVSLPEGGKEQPLVVLNTPDGPSDILQKPATEQQVASAPNAPETETADAGAPASGSGSAEDDTVVAAVTDGAQTDNGASQQVASQASEPAADSEEVQSAAVSTGSQDEPAQNATSPEADTSTAVADASAEDGTSTDASQETTARAGETETPVSGEETQTASAEPETQTRSLAETAETEDPAPATDTAAGQADDTRPDTETAGSAGVETASVDTAAPATGQEDAEAATAAAAPQGQSAPEATAAPAEPAQDAAPAAAADEPTVTVEAVESETDKVYVAGTGEPGSSVRVYVGDDFQGEAQVNASGKWLVQGSKNIAEGNVEVRADLIAEDGNTVDARAAVTFEKEQDKQIVLTKVVASGASGETAGQGAEVKKTLPVVIIRKGDNLWRISRRLYGEGVRYTTIYQANQDQIRNPDLIYPGQVFLTPEGDLNWKQPNENNG